MRRSALLSGILICVLHVIAVAQPCHCPDALGLISAKVEENLASYQHQVVQRNRQQPYQVFKQDILLQSQKIADQKECKALVARYFAFFSDNNLSLGYAKPYPFTLTDTVSIRRYFQKDKPCAIKGKAKPKDVAAGRWYFQDGTHTIDIIPHKTALHDYAGVIASGDSLFWYPAQLRLELRHLQTNQYECILWSNTRIPKVYTALLRDSTLYIGRMFTFHRSRAATVAPPDISRRLTFEQLSDRTNYLRLPSLHYDSGRRIDTLLHHMRDRIISKPNLIVDIRGNRGGSDWSYHTVIPFVFSSPVVPGVVRASTWASADNLELFARDKYSFCKTKEDTAMVDEYQNKLRKQAGKFTEYLFHSSRYDTAYTSPVHVAILVDRYVGASAENFLLLAKESRKVVTFGENSAGSMSYGNTWTTEVPALGLNMYLPVSIMVVHDNRNYEFTGIGADYPLDTRHPDTWIAQAQRYLEETGR